MRNCHVIQFGAGSSIFLVVHLKNEEAMHSMLVIFVPWSFGKCQCNATGALHCHYFLLL